MAPPTEAARALYAKSGIQRFGPPEAGKLAEQLTNLDARTQIRPINNVEDLALLPNGATREGYRYTAIGFNQLAYELSPGLSTLVPDMAGCFRKPSDEVERFDLGAAISVFNTVLTLRFDILRRQRLVCDLKQKRIDGLIGPKRQYLRNHEMLQAANDAMLVRRDVLFAAAELVGRRLTLWYRAREPAFKLKCRSLQHPFWHGYYFCNSEASGTGLRGTDTLFNKHGCALGPFRQGTRMAHVGKTFRKRADKLFSKVVDRDLQLARCQDGLKHLVAIPLQVVGSTEDRDQQITRLAHTLCRGRKISKWVSQDVVQNALAYGADDHELTQLDLAHPEPYQKRTAYDLFCALLRRSRKLDLDRREVVEQAAYELMLGKIKLGDR